MCKLGKVKELEHGVVCLPTHIGVKYHMICTCGNVRIKEFEESLTINMDSPSMVMFYVVCPSGDNAIRVLYRDKNGILKEIVFKEQDGVKIGARASYIRSAIMGDDDARRFLLL